jgi:hypothetical protein
VEIMPTPRVSDEFGLQALEPRVLFAALAPAALSIGTTFSVLGNVLTVGGTNGDDIISIINTSAGLKISTAAGWSTIYSGSIACIKVNAGAGNDRVTIDRNIRTDTMLFGGTGIDTLSAGSGNDKLYGGADRDYCYGNVGNDTIVTIGDGAIDRLYGGLGIDNFWCDTAGTELLADVTSDEVNSGAVHRVGSFLSGTFGAVTLSAPLTLAGQKLADPTMTSDADAYQNFSDRPLFSRYGPIADDIFQGMLGDCYLLAALGSVAKANPQAIRNSIVELGDGTYAVQFTDGATKTFIRIDGDLPTDAWGLAYANFGRQQSIWVALMEKAYAFFRTRQGSYGSLTSGFMGDVYSHMGLSNSSTFSSTNLIQQIQADLSAGKAITLGTKSNVGALPVTGGHAYIVDAVAKDTLGNVTSIRLRNPWGVDDAAGFGANDGFITLTPQQLLQAFWFVCTATAK